MRGDINFAATTARSFDGLPINLFLSVNKLAGVEDDIDELTAASNTAVDLVHAGKLDEAERAAYDLLERFPDVHEGMGSPLDGLQELAAA